MSDWVAFILFLAAGLSTPFVGYAIADRFFAPKPKR
jgi:hypothetical protein